MKNLIIILALLVSTSVFAQREWGNVQKNEVTLNEIPPIWPGCEKGNVTARKACFKKKLYTHVAQNFKYPASEYKNKVQGKVIVSFVINEKGLVEIKDVTGGTKALQEAAKQNIMAIPKMSKPGMMGGKPRAIKYKVPFNFKV
jgi:protein TonB